MRTFHSALSLIALFVLIVLTVVLLRMYKTEDGVPITDFESCVAAGNPVQESYPERCVSKNGEAFSRDIGNELEKIDLIRISSPRPGDKVTSPLSISGEARGLWYFEASFPVRLLDDKGNVIAAYYATAKEEWMTEDFVPFETVLTFEMPESGSGVLILHKDNPSGLPQHDDELRVPVQFR